SSVSCNSFSKSVELKNEIDSVNYALGSANGFGIKDYYLRNDSTEGNVKALIKGINQAIKSKDDKTLNFYALGLNIGSSIVAQTEVGLLGDSTIEANIELIRKALIDAIQGAEVAMDAEEADAYLRGIMEKKQAEKAEAEYAENKKAGEDFLAENAKKEGVVVTPSGLQYEIIKAGNGELPTDNDRVKVQYHGTLLDGTVFDSSVNRGNPAEFVVSGVIKGWTEALKMMPVGSKWKLYIPQELAYGSRDNGTIKPFSMLIFEVELLSIEK
ncbi:MAG: FKBP-type peptidyl-prolyl cis-trans isomerase, partial [Paludibacteraceae bacterium]|nr:FKBP-type peptidyl-prolyl cis-trans isomerase [Paludibacteraceae bacterium]